ncbi:hypothetical protein AHAS_Ahas11G0116600 [Arachis hypogaea]
MFKEVRCEIEEAGKLNVVTHSVSNNEVKVRINKYRQPGRECEVQYDKATKKFACDCRLFESRGISCHVFCTMRHDHIDIIPDTLVCTRWTKNAKKDYVCSVTSVETDSENIAGIRYGALSILCFTLFGDPTVVKTKRAPRQNRCAIKSRKCSHCTRRGHTIRRCPELYSRDVLHTGHHQSSDELNDEKSYSEEEINHQSNDESNVQSVDHRYFNDNGTNKLATQKNKNGVKATKVNNKKYEEMDTQLKQMEETVNNLQKMYFINQPNFSIGLSQPIMPFPPILPNFYGPFTGFTQTSPPCTPPSIHMHMPPYPPLFASYIPDTPLTDAIMEKLKSPIDKSAKTIVKKTNTNAGRKKELPRKGLVSVGKKLYSPKSSPTEILKSLLGKGSPTEYSINHNTLPNLNLRRNDSGIEAPFAMYIEEMLQDDSFYDLETIARPKVSRFADPKHIETGEQKIGS